MSLYSINDTTLTAIGNAIREKNGSSESYTPGAMADAILAIQGGGGDSNFIRDWFNGAITELTASDLNGVTSFNDYALVGQTALARLEIPSSVTWIGASAIQNTPALKELTLPATLSTISYLAFTSSGVTDLTLLKEDRIVTTHVTKGNNSEYAIPSYGVGALRNIYVSGKLYDAYRNSTSWGGLTEKLHPFDEYVGKPAVSSFTLLYNERRTISLPLLNFNEAPSANINYGSGTVNVENINTTETEITFDIVALEAEGDNTVSVEVARGDGYVFSFEISVTTVAKLADTRYEVIKPDDVTYGFELNENGFYESTNKKIANSFAYAKVHIYNPDGLTVYVDCINYAESNYDYGALSYVNADLQRVSNTSVDSMKHNFKGKQMATVQTVTYTDAVGECYITIKFIKDGSGDEGNDSLQFKIRFE